ncbi:single strand DNA binding protein [Mycobacterium phage Lolly9]|uniref:Single-stranded DNA-binding protein n=1 Tax=Mycobacterium phage Lolly9 TaxID=1698711 RepID=A0A0K2FNC8_9CAUD|nr:single strand DNA binding protein [Mycobacterium phage Lolly9]ALA48499.1 ssDNA binding protein [Mycobacterium phage Lolly9]QOP65811.1 ssDNA-binding protein [Mycobacterium phage MiniLon]QOP66558.1 ssDNA-binding protein [Mycobacterium phage MiniMac]
MANAAIQIQGNLTADPELRFLDSGVAVAQFSVASTPRKFNKQTNEWEDGETVFLRTSVWRELAEGAAENLRKGDNVVVIGNLKQRAYEKDGQTRTVFEIDGEFVGKSVRARKSGGGSKAPANDGPGW